MECTDIIIIRLMFERTHINAYILCKMYNSLVFFFFVFVFIFYKYENIMRRYDII